MTDMNRDQKVVTESSTPDESIMVGDFFGNDTMPDVIAGALREIRGYDFIDADLMALLPDTDDVWTEQSDVRDMVLYARFYLPFSNIEWYVTSKFLREDGAVTFAGYALVAYREWGLDLGLWDVERIEVPVESMSMTVMSPDGSWVEHNPVRVVERDFDWKPMTAREAGMPTFFDSGFDSENTGGTGASRVTVKWTTDDLHFVKSPASNPFSPAGGAKKPSKGALKKAAQKARREGRAA